MDILRIEGTERTPLILFDFPGQHCRIEGESYPEDTAAFFGPPLRALAQHLDGLGQAALLFDVNLRYFNSSSAKALMNIFQMLERAAARGARVTIGWFYAPDDDAMLEFGEDFAEDFEHAQFHLRPLASGAADPR